MSKAIGEHEVVREEKSRSERGANRRDRTDRERVVMPSEIVSMPNLTALVAFAGDRPVARTKLAFQNFREQAPAFIERHSVFGG